MAKRVKLDLEHCMPVDFAVEGERRLLRVATKGGGWSPRLVGIRGRACPNAAGHGRCMQLWPSSTR